MVARHHRKHQEHLAVDVVCFVLVIELHLVVHIREYLVAGVTGNLFFICFLIWRHFWNVLEYAWAFARFLLTFVFVDFLKFFHCLVVNTFEAQISERLLVLQHLIALLAFKHWEIVWESTLNLAWSPISYKMYNPPENFVYQYQEREQYQSD